MQRSWPCKDLRSCGHTSHTSAKTRADSGDANSSSGNATFDLAHRKDAEMASTLKYNMLWGTNNIAFVPKKKDVEKYWWKHRKGWKTVRTFQMQRMEPETPRPDRTNLRCGNHGVDSRVIFVIRLQQNGEKPQNLACYAVWVLHEITIEQRKVFRNSIGKASTESVARNGHAFSNGRVHEDSTYTSTLLVAPSRTCTNFNSVLFNAAFAPQQVRTTVSHACWTKG